MGYRSIQIAILCTLFSLYDSCTHVWSGLDVQSVNVAADTKYNCTTVVLTAQHIDLLLIPCNN
jgi:hypothetical protein